MIFSAIKLGSFAKVKGGKRLPKGAQLYDEPTEHPYIRVTDMFSDGLNSLQIKYIDQQTHDSISRYTISIHDVYISIAGTIGRVGMVPDTFNGANLTENAAKITDIDSSFNPRFLMYFLRSYLGQGQIAAKTGGTSQPKLALYRIEEIDCPKLPRDMQDEIVLAAKNYDDLIENNRRRIQLLEESARLLYQEWFVHLRFPGHEQAKITDGVPEGWDKTTADNVMDVLSGGTPKTKVPEFWDGEIPFFTPKDAKGLFTYDTEKTITDLGLSKCNSRLYPKYTVFITARGTVGKLSFAQRPMAMNQSCYALIAKGEISQEFLYSSLKASIEQFKARASGAVFDAIVVDTFKNIPFLIPSSSLRDEFTEQVKGVFSQIDNLSIQNMKLAQARDLLLPKLMSGELTV